MASLTAIALFAIACNHSNAATTSDAGVVVAAPKPADDSEAREVVAVLRRTHPIACAVAIDDAWTHCHDDMKGFANLRACVSKGLATAQAAQRRKPVASATTPCGRKVEGAELGLVDGVVTMLGDVLVWLDTNKGWLASQLAAGTLSDCESCVEKGLPDLFSNPKYAAANYATVQDAGNACTRQLFNCEGEGDCNLSKAAMLLHIACDPKENDNLGEKLTARSTGAVLN